MTDEIKRPVSLMHGMRYIDGYANSEWVEDASGKVPTREQIVAALNAAPDAGDFATTGHMTLAITRNPRDAGVRAYHGYRFDPPLPAEVYMALLQAGERLGALEYLAKHPEMAGPLEFIPGRVEVSTASKPDAALDVVAPDLGDVIGGHGRCLICHEDKPLGAYRTNGGPLALIGVCEDCTHAAVVARDAGRKPDAGDVAALVQALHPGITAYIRQHGVSLAGDPALTTAVARLLQSIVAARVDALRAENERLRGALRFVLAKAQNARNVYEGGQYVGMAGMDHKMARDLYDATDGALKERESGE